MTAETHFHRAELEPTTAASPICRQNPGLTH
jgi:hypothetical protein